MKTRNEMIEEALAKKPSNPSARPPKVSLIAYSRDELLSVLGTTQPANDKARDLLAGVTNAGEGSTLTVVREDLLTALGADIPNAPANEPETKPNDKPSKRSGDRDAKVS